MGSVRNLINNFRSDEYFPTQTEFGMHESLTTISTKLYEC